MRINLTGQTVSDFNGQFTSKADLSCIENAEALIKDTRIYLTIQLQMALT